MILDIGFEIIYFKPESKKNKKIIFFDNLIKYKDNILNQNYDKTLMDYKNFLEKGDYKEIEKYNNSKKFIYTIYYFKNYLKTFYEQKNVKVIQKKIDCLKVNKFNSNNKNILEGSSNRLKSKNFNLRKTILSKFQNKNPLIYLSMDKILKNNKINEKSQNIKRILKKYKKKKKINPLISKKFICNSKNKNVLKKKVFNKIELLLKYDEKVQKKKGILKNNHINYRDLTNKDINIIFKKERETIENQINKRKLKNKILPKFKKKINHKRNYSNNNENKNSNLGFSLRLGLKNIKSQSKLINKIHKLDCKINHKSFSILKKKNPFSYMSTNTYHLKTGALYNKFEKKGNLVVD